MLEHRVGQTVYLLHLQDGYHVALLGAREPAVFIEAVADERFRHCMEGQRPDEFAPARQTVLSLIAA
jgi:hypothetical protein